MEEEPKGTDSCRDTFPFSFLRSIKKDVAPYFIHALCVCVRLSVNECEYLWSGYHCLTQSPSNAELVPMKEAAVKKKNSVKITSLNLVNLTSLMMTTLPSGGTVAFYVLVL